MRLPVLVFFILTIPISLPAKDILLLNSYHTGFKWTEGITTGVLEAAIPKEEYRVFVEYMDYKRFQHKDYFYELSTLYKYKYGDTQIDGIICADNYAFDFFLVNGDNIWNNQIPVSICGVNNIETYEYDHQRITGIKETIDFLGTLKLAQQLQPDLDTFIVISDNTLSGNIFLNQFQNKIKQLSKPTSYIIYDGSDYDALKTKLENTNPKNKAIILLSLYSHKNNIPMEMIDIGKELTHNLNIPIYSFWNFLLGDFIVGGSLLSPYDQGYQAANLIIDQINNPQNSQRELLPSTYDLTVDFKLIQNLQLDESKIPSNAIIINKETPFYIRFKQELIFFLSTLIVLVSIIMFLINNIIKRKKTELKLIESEKRLELAINSANEGLWDILLPERKTIYNKNLANLFGYKHEHELDISVYNWRSYFPQEELLQIKEAFLIHTKGITPYFKIETPIFQKDGTLRHVALHGKVTERIDSKPSRITGVIMDISAQKEFETQLKIAKDKAEESDRLKSSFLANMSHEIRTPMNAILGFSDILMSQELSAKEMGSYLLQIKNSGENLLNIINDIVDISKIESGQLTIRKEKFNLNELLNNIESSTRVLIKTKNKSISAKFIKESVNETFLFYCDPFRLEQILLNLISNAVKFTQKGGIVVQYANHNTYLKFTVKDTGEGISEKDQEIIFERFRQAENSSRKLLSGTGLGLSITKSLVELLGGKIVVSSKVNKGSTFTVYLPTNKNLLTDISSLNSCSSCN